MLFKIRVRLTCGQKFLELWTDSIKVVAKLDSIRKKQAEREGGSVVGRKNKRARSDDLLDSLSSIQEQQRYQAQLLNNLLIRMNSPELSTLTSPVSPPHSPLNAVCVPNSPPRSPASTVTVNPGSDPLEAAFHQFLQVYSQVDVDERPRKMRRLMDTLDSDKKKEVSDFGCVLADFTDATSRDEESVIEPESSPSSNSSYSAS